MPKYINGSISGTLASELNVSVISGKLSLPSNISTNVEPITITENGVYTAPDRTAYSPVTVDVPSIDLSGDTVEAGKMVNGTTAHDKNGNSIVGSISEKTADDVTVADNTVTVPAGYYAESVSKTVAGQTLEYESGEYVLENDALQTDVVIPFANAHNSAPNVVVLAQVIDSNNPTPNGYVVLTVVAYDEILNVGTYVTKLRGYHVNGAAMRIVNNNGVSTETNSAMTLTTDAATQLSTFVNAEEIRLGSGTGMVAGTYRWTAYWLPPLFDL